MNNRIKRKICAVGLAAFLLVSVSAAGNAVCKDADVSVSAAEADESFEYEDRGYDELTLIGYKGSEKNVVIPREINGKKVVEIDSDVGTHAHINPHQGGIFHTVTLGDIVHHLCIPHHIGIERFSLGEIDHPLTSFKLVEFLSIHLLDGEARTPQPCLPHPAGVVLQLDGVGHTLVMLVPKHRVHVK